MNSKLIVACPSMYGKHVKDFASNVSSFAVGIRPSDLFIPQAVGRTSWMGDQPCHKAAT